MKPKTSPTSPKASVENSDEIEKLYGTPLKSFDRPPLATRPSVVWLVIILLIGFIAGIVGQLSLIWFSDELPFLEKLGFSSGETPSVILSSRNKDQALTAEQVEVIAQDLDHTIVTLYRAAESPGGLENQYVSGEQIGSGFIITEDGYVITDGSLVADDQTYVAVGYDGSVYAVTDTMRDSATPYAILKIDASQLSTVGFSDIDAIRNTEEVIVLFRDTGGRSPRVLKTTIQQSRYFPIQTGGDLVLTSEAYQSRVLLGASLDADFLGSVAFTMDKKALGIIQREHDTYTVVPFDHVASILDAGFADARIDRPELGVRYIMLDMLADGSTIGSGAANGALIWETEAEPGIIRGSLAEKAGLLVNDIITEIDGSALSASRTLSDSILEHVTGDTVALTILRDGSEQKVNLTVE